MAKKSSSKQHLLADVPISCAKQDQLGRAPFAQSLARTVLSMKGQESFVFGLCGPWGSGKSSVLKLVVSFLGKGKASARPVVIEFNPWWFSGRDQLLHAFLSQLGAALGRVDSGKRTTKLGERLSTLGKVLRPFGWIPGASVLKDVGEVIEKAGDATTEVGEHLAADVHAVREDIDDLLRKLDRRIVIVMDDIDRLTATEIAQLFLIVKAVADFPNTAYLLAFDQDVVSNAISTELKLDGVSYLEKIVQVQVDLPHAGPIPLQQMFLSQIGDLIRDDLVTESSRHAFGSLFHAGVKDFLRTPRAVKRIVNVLRVLYPAVEGEVYWPDFVGIASLMTFAPVAFRAVRDNPDQFTGTDFRQSGERDQANEFHGEWLGQVPEQDRNSASGIVSTLFPKAKSILENYGLGGEWEARWRADLRVCSAEYFPRYFQLSVPAGAISEKEWASIIQRLPDEAAFDACIGRLCGTRGPHGFVSRAKEFLERVSNFAKFQANQDQAKRLFKALLRSGDKLIEVEDAEVAFLLPIGNDLRVSWALQESLLRIDDQGAREQFAEECLESVAALHTACHFVWLLGAQHGRFGSSASESHRPCYVSEACVDRLVAAMLNQIQEAARNGSLARHPKAMLIAREWRTFGQPSEAKEWVNSVATDDRVLVGFVSQLRSVAHSQGGGDRVARQHPQVNAGYLVTWFDPLELRRRCAAILDRPPDWLDDEATKTLRLLVGSIEDDGAVVDVFERRRQRLMAGEQEDEE